MSLALSASRSGMPTCAIEGLWLHSRYDPEREALRFAESELGRSRPSHVVLLGPCLDYLSRAVRLILPGARIVSVQYSTSFAQASIGSADATWYPNAGVSPEPFLDQAIDEDAVSGVAVLEWEPAARAFPAEALAARRAVRASLDRLASSAATVKSAGKQWIANACSSFLLAQSILVPERSQLPVLVAAAGPSLRRSLLSLADRGRGFSTIAVSSAVAACLAAGVRPDIVVATDGGYWSRLHLYPLRAQPLPLASPLTALPSSSLYRRSGLVLLDQGSFAESELLRDLGASIAVPPHGTVSGTAIQLAARLSDGPIVVAGLDLAAFGELEHALPHGFDAAQIGREGRCAPRETAVWSRIQETAPLALPDPPWRGSRSLSAYASALALDARPLAGRLFRLFPSPVPLSGFAEIEPSELRALVGGEHRGFELSPAPLPSIGRREELLRSRIASWRELAAEAAAAMGEGGLLPTPLVAELLRSIDLVDYAAARRAIVSGGRPSTAARDLALRCEAFLSALERRFFP